MSNPFIRLEEKGTVGFYFTGFILCVILTLAAYFLVTEKLLTGGALIGVILLFSVIQMGIQLVVFMHIGSERHHHWNLMVLFFMLGVLVIIVFGSLWIMNGVSYREMPPMDMSGK